MPLVPARGLGAQVRRRKASGHYEYEDNKSTGDRIYHGFHVVGRATTMAKKNGKQPKVLPYSSVSFGDYGIVTTYEQPDVMSQQKWSEIPIEARKQYEELDMSEAPFAQASTRDSLRKYSHGLFVQGSLGPEYMGSHGVGGLIAPPMEYFDDRLDWFRAREVNHRVNRRMNRRSVMACAGNEARPCHAPPCHAPPWHAPPCLAPPCLAPP